jgi:hypothetical protein
MINSVISFVRAFYERSHGALTTAFAATTPSLLGKLTHGIFDQFDAAPHSETPRMSLLLVLLSIPHTHTISLNYVSVVRNVW